MNILGKNRELEWKFRGLIAKKNIRNHQIYTQ